jgi:hypothetical protein
LAHLIHRSFNLGTLIFSQVGFIGELSLPINLAGASQQAKTFAAAGWNLLSSFFPLRCGLPASFCEEIDHGTIHSEMRFLR